jgi:hypothetical protein
MLTLILAAVIGLTLGWMVVLALPKMMAGPAPESEGVLSGENEESRAAGFMSSTGIKTLLLSGAALVIWSVYLFVRSYWTALPDVAKFAGLAVLGLAAHGGGLLLSRRGWVPRTARTLVGLGLAVSPFIVYSARVWLLPGLWTSVTAWGWGLAFLSALAAVTVVSSPAWEAGYLLAAGATGAIGLGMLSRTADAQLTLAAAAAAAAGAVVLGDRLKSREDVSRGVQHASFTAWIAVAGTLAYQGFFWRGESQWAASVALALLGAAAALAARWYRSLYALPAAAAIAGAGALALRHFDLPLYEYGYVFGPMGLMALWRAHTWEKAGNTSLARPVFWFGHACLVVSAAAVTPTFWTPGDASLPALLGVMGLVGAAYAIGGAFHASPFYAYASGVMVLLLTGALTRQTDALFSNGVLFFTAAGGALWLLGLVSGVDDERHGKPFTVLAMGTLTVAMALLGGKWGQQLLFTGSVAPAMTPAQMDAGLWTGGVSLIAYGFLAFTKRRAVFVYPLFYSATWIYVCLLERGGHPLTLVSFAWVTAGAMGIYYLLDAFGSREVGRGARLWGLVSFIFVACAAATSTAPTALPALLIGMASFLPGVWKGKTDVSLGFLGSIYLAHYLFFRQGFPVMDARSWALFALQGVAVNCGVIFVRTVLTYARPQANLAPFRLAAFFYAALGLGLSVQDLGIAWQVFAAYGVLSLAVSFLHYQGRYWGIGAALLAASLEIFFYHHGARYVEAFTWPMASLLAAMALARRHVPEERDFLFGFMQVVMYGPSSVIALREHWGAHGLMLGLAGLAGLLFGVLIRNRCLTIGSVVVMLANAAFQSRDLIWSLPGWAYLGLGGAGLITLAAVFEFRRETLTRFKDGIAEAWDRWE